MSTPNTPDLAAENAELRARLAEAEETLEAIRTGAVDALVMGEEIYTLKGAETPYRLLIESMNEGAATLAPDGTILYCNARLADMLAARAERIIGSCFWDRVVPAQQPLARALVGGASQTGARAELTFSTPDGPGLPVLLSLRPIHRDSEALALVATDLTERKRAEEALRQAHDVLEQRVRERTEELQQQREWLSVTLGSIGDALIATDAAGRITFLNPVAEALTGWPREEVLGQPAQSVFRIHDETTRNPGEDIVGRVLREGATVKLANNTCLIARDGHEIPIEDSAAPIKDRDGRVAGAVLVFRDVSGKRRAQNALRESEARMQQALRISRSFTFEWQPATDTVQRSASCATILHLAGDEASQDTGQRFFQRVHPDDRARFVQRLGELTPAANTYTTDYRLLCNDGGIVVLEEIAQATFDAAGQLARVVGVTTDITARKRAEADLERVRNMLAEGQRIAHLGSWEYIADTQSAVWSDEQKRIYGLDPAAASPVYAEMLRHHIHPEDAAALDKAFGEALRSGSVFENENRIVRPDGSVRFIYNKAQPYFDEAGKLVRYVGATLDITDRKLAEENLSASERRERERAAELAALLDAVPTPVFFAHDPDCRHITGNRAAEELLRNPPGGEASLGAAAETKPQHFKAVKDGRELPVNELPAQRAARGEKMQDFEFSLVFNDGTIRNVVANGAPLLDETGNPRGSIMVLADITDRKHAEATLRASEARVKVDAAVRIERQRLQEVLNMLPAYVILLSPDYRVPLANRFFEERFGESEGRRCYEYLFHRTEPCENCETYKVLKTGKPHRWEWTGPDGRNYDIYDFPFKDVDGSPLIMEVGLDITQRRHAEAELTKHREHLQELVDERTAELQATNDELTRFNQAMVGRELRMIELKQEINVLCAKLGQSPRYALAPQAEPQPPQPS